MVKPLQNVTCWKVSYPNIFFQEICSSGGKQTTHKVSAAFIVKNCHPRTSLSGPVSLNKLGKFTSLLTFEQEEMSLMSSSSTVANFVNTKCCSSKPIPKPETKELNNSIYQAYVYDGDKTPLSIEDIYIFNSLGCISRCSCSCALLPTTFGTLPLHHKSYKYHDKLVYIYMYVCIYIYVRYPIISQF